MQQFVQSLPANDPNSVVARSGCRICERTSPMWYARPLQHQRLDRPDRPDSPQSAIVFSIGVLTAETGAGSWLPRPTIVGGHGGVSLLQCRSGGASDGHWLLGSRLARSWRRGHLAPTLPGRRPTSWPVRLQRSRCWWCDRANVMAISVASLALGGPLVVVNHRRAERSRG